MLTLRCSYFCLFSADKQCYHFHSSAPYENFVILGQPPILHSSVLHWDNDRTVIYVLLIHVFIGWSLKCGRERLVVLEKNVDRHGQTETHLLQLGLCADTDAELSTGESFFSTLTCSTAVESISMLLS